MAYSRKRTSYRRKPYARKATRAKAPRAHFVSGGVGGAAAYMAPGMQLPQEVKYKDTAIANVPNQTGDWTIVCGNALFGIVQGSGNNQRIGRSIRVVGMVLRAAIVTNGAAAGAAPSPQPYTMDFIWDRQCNGDLATVTQIYTGATRFQLPNPLYESRFKFIKRVERDATLQQAWTTANVNIKCNKVVEFDASSGAAGAITDLSGTNLLITMSSADIAPVITGMVVRILYVDA